MKRRFWLLVAAVLLLTIVLLRPETESGRPDSSRPTADPSRPDDLSFSSAESPVAAAGRPSQDTRWAAVPATEPRSDAATPPRRKGPAVDVRPRPRGGRPVPVRVETSEVLIFLRPEADARAFAADLGIELGYSLKAVPHAHVFAAATPAAAREALERAKADPRVARAFLNERTQHVHCDFVPDDPLIPDGANPPFHGQWHLGNGASTSHANLAGAWNRDLTGSGVRIGIVDDSLETSHPDLAPNYVAADSFNFGNNTADPNANPAFDGSADEDRHGTSVSGVAAARGGNGQGTTGAAPLAGLAGLRISFPTQTTAMFVNATLFHSSGGNTNIKIKNHSYGSTAPFIAAPAESQAVTDSSAAGTIHLFAAGNERGTQAQDSNKTEPQNNPDAIAVAAVGSDGRFSWYSSFGANVFVTAPSSGVSGFGILTTDRTNARGYNPNVTLPIPPPPQQTPDDFDTFPDTAYTSKFGGTSSATPLAAGIMALGKQAKPALDVRFAKHALTRSSFQVDPADNTTTGGGDGLTPGSAWKTNAAGVKFNQNYGFGRIDADRFVHQLLQMDGVTAQATESVGPTAVGAAIPDNNVNGVVRTFAFASTARMEEILVTLAITHTYRGDLQAHLTSPSGTTRRLFSIHNADGVNNINWTFVSNEFWGEIPTGTWTLRVADVLAVDTGTWTSYSVTARTGTVNDTVAPVVESIVAAAANPSLAASVPFTVTFSEPVSGVNLADFALTTTGGISGASVTGVTGGPWIYTVTVNTGSGDGTIRLDVADNDSIQDLAGNRLGGTGVGNGSFTAGEAYTIDKTAPLVLGVSSSTADGAYPATTSIPVTVTFGEPVRVTGTPQLRLATGGAGTLVNYSGGTDTATLTFTYVVAPGHASPDLDYFSAGALTGTIRDPAGNNAVLALASPGAAGSLGANKNLVIDTANPGAPGTPAGAPALNNGSFTVSWSAASDAGSGVASYTVRRSDNLGPFNVIATGVAGTSLPQTSMAQGSYRYQVLAVDAAGNIGPVSGTSGAVTVDTSAPLAPSTPDLLLADDSGASGTDNITNQTTLSFSGTAEAGSTVQLFVDGLGGATTTAAGGNWTLAATVAPGVRSVTAQATDPAGNPSPVSAALLVTVDVSPPAQPSTPDLAAGDDLGTSNSDDLTSLTSLSFSGTAENGVSVRLFVDGAGGAMTTAAGGGWTLVAPSVAAGTRSITVRATDAAGNVGTDSAALLVTVDTTPPAAPSTPDLDAASDTGNPADNLTSATSLSFSGTAEDGTTVQLLVDAVAVATTTATGGTWTLVAPVAAGLRSITARTSDPAGNLSPGSPALMVTVDATLPVAPSLPDLDALSDTGNATDNLTSLTALTFSGTAEDGTTVQLFVDGAAGATTTATGGAWTLLAPSVAVGVRSITARSTDPAGNVGPFSAALSVTVDPDAPAAPSAPDLDAASDSGVNTDDVTNLTSLTFTGTAEAGVSVQIFVDGAGGAATIATGGAWSLTAPSVAPGVRSITARATDGAGNVGPFSPALSVTVDTGVPAPPSVPDLDASSDSADPSDNLTHFTTLSFSGTAEAGTTVQLFFGATPGPSALAAGGVWTIVASGVPAGAHSITARSSDGAGNVSGPSGALSVTVDTTLPAAPTAPDLDAASDSANSADNVTNLTSLTFTGTAEAGTTVQLFVDGVGGATTTAAGGAWTIVATVAPGVRSITARSTDTAGNVGPFSTALSVTVDTGAPAAPSAPDLDPGSDSGPSNTDNLTSLTSLSFSGTAEDGAIVQLFVDGVGGATTTATGGAWTIVAPAVTAGVRSITARAADVAGNSSLDSGALSVTVDATLPATPSVPDLDAASDTANPTDNITSATTPSFSGTAEAGAVVRLFAGAVQVGSATAGAGGTWTIVASPLAGGTYPFTATATDTAGNASAPSAALSVTIDIDPPAAPPGLPDLEAASDSGFLNIDNRTNLTTLSFSGTAEPGSTVQLFVGGVPGTTVVAAAGTGAWTLTAASLAEGAHLFGARATDVAGNVGPMSGLTQVIIDLTSPAAPSVPDLDPADDHGFSNGDNITNQPNVPLAGTADAGAFVQIFVDGVAGPTATADGAGTWSFGLVTIGSGTHSITAQATDVSGNVGPLSAALSITIDASVPPAPSIPDLDPASDTGASPTDNITNLTTLTFTGTAEDGTSVQLFVEGVAGATTTAAGGIWTLVASSVAPGVRTVTARATDLAGNVTFFSGGLFVTVDTTAPAAPSAPDLQDAGDSGASPTDNLTKNTSLSFAGTAEAGASVQLFVDGAPGATTTADAWTLVASPVAEGVHTITAVATDAAGNVGPASSGLVVTVDLTPPAPPSVPDLQAASDTGTSPTDNLTRFTSVTFTGTAEAGASVRLFVDGAPGAITTGGAWSLDATGLAEGVRQITAVATDAAGNAGSASAALAVTIDTQAPNAPSVPDLDAASDLGSSSTDNLTSLATLSFSGTADADASVQLFVDGAGGGTATATGGAWTIGAPGLVPGVRSITARATDAAGNSSGASGALSVTIDSSLPSAPSVPDLADASDSGTSSTDNLTRLTSLSFSGTAEAGSTVRVFVDGVSAGTTTATGGAWTLIVSPVTPGIRTITATALDSAGNLSPESGGLVVTVDTTAPAVPPAPVLDAASDTGASSSDRITTLHVLSFTGTAEADAAIALLVGVTPVGAAAAGGTGAYAVTSSFIGDAAHSVTVTATDAAGNVSAPSPTLLVIVDNTAPPAGLVEDGLTGDASVQASATTISAHWSGFDDPLSGILRYEIAVGTTPGGAQISGFADVGTATSATGGPFALVHGTTYFVTVRATNPVNLQSTATSNGVTVDLQPPAPPGSLVAVPADGGATLYWTASPSGDVAFYRAWSKPASAPWSAATLSDNLAGLSALVPGLANGVLHDFRLVAVDAAGNESTDLFASATPQPAVRIQGGGTFGTIQAALDAALPGQTVILGPGTFVGDLIVRPGVSLQGWSPQYTVIQGVITVEGTFGSGMTSTISQLAVTGGATGMSSASADLTVRNVVVHHVAGHGIAAGAAGRLAAINVTLISNGGDGLQSLGATIVRNAISGQNGGWGLNVPASATVTYSDAFGNTTGDFSAGGGGTGNFSAVALFAADYTNPATSPTVDVGDPADDFSGEPVPNGGRIDLGAFGNTAWAPLTTMPVVLSGGGGGGGGGGCGLTGLEILVLLALRRRIRR